MNEEETEAVKVCAVKSESPSAWVTADHVTMHF